jgi:hypothetical protein
MGRDTIKRLPIGISLPIQEVLSHEYFKSIYVQSVDSKKLTIEDWPKEIFKLIEREDLYYNLQEMKKNKEQTDEATPEFQFSRISQMNISKKFSKRSSTFKLGRTESNVFAGMKKSNLNKNSKAKVKQPHENSDEIETQEYINLIEKEFKSLGLKNGSNKNKLGNVSEGNFINYRFSSDLRYMEVSLMLDSSIPFKMRIDRIEGIETMDNQRLDEVKTIMHENLVTRQFSKCVGRGALKLGTIHTVPTEKLKILEISKTALLPPDNKKIELRDDHN